MDQYAYQEEKGCCGHFSASCSHKSLRVKPGSHFKRHDRKDIKYALSSTVNLFPLPPVTTLVGGLGDREGGSGILSSAFGAGKRALYEAVCVVILLIVDRRPLVVGPNFNSGLDDFEEDLDVEALGSRPRPRLRDSAGDKGGEGSGWNDSMVGFFTALTTGGDSALFLSDRETCASMRSRCSR